MIIRQYVPIKVPTPATVEATTQKKKRRRQKKKKILHDFDKLTLTSTTTDTTPVDFLLIEEPTGKSELYDSGKPLLQELSECGSYSTKNNSESTPTRRSPRYSDPNYFSEIDQNTSLQLLEPIYTKTFLTSFLKTYVTTELPEELKFYATRRCELVSIDLSSEGTPIMRRSYNERGSTNSVTESPFVQRRSFKTMSERKIEELLQTDCLPLLRRAVTEEEKSYKEKIASTVGKWTSHVKAKSPSEQLEMSIRFHLNILTPENYEIVKMDLLNIAKEGIAAAEKVSDLIIEKAWNEVKYAKVYARLCEFLSKDASLFFQKDSKKNDFKVYTLRKIQHSFDNESVMNPKTSKALCDLDPEEKAIFLAKKKKLVIGNVIFIGELFIRNFLTSQVIRICMSTLLSRFFKEYRSNEDTEGRAEDHLEALIALLENTGKIIEDKERLNPSDFAGSEGSLVKACKSLLQNWKQGSKISTLKFPLADVFQCLELISQLCHLSSRLKSLIQNLNHRKANNWKAPEFATQQPKTLKQIREEMESETQLAGSKVKTNGANTATTPTKKTQAPTLMTLEEVTDTFGRIFKQFDASSEEEEALEGFKGISAKTDHNTFIKGFMKTFSDGSKSIVARRLEFFPRLVASKLINGSAFPVAFGECLFDLWMEASDFPGIEANYAKIYADMICADMTTLSDFYIHPSLAGHDDKEYILETYSQFFTELKIIVHSSVNPQSNSAFSGLDELITKVSRL